MPFFLMIFLAICFSAGPACASEPAAKPAPKADVLIRTVNPATAPEKKKPLPPWTMVPRDPGFCSPAAGNISALADKTEPRP
jgi:hypothetical protein